MTPIQLIAVSKIDEFKRKLDVQSASVAARAAHTDEKGWQKFQSEILKW